MSFPEWHGLILIPSVAIRRARWLEPEQPPSSERLTSNILRKKTDRRVSACKGPEDMVLLCPDERCPILIPRLSILASMVRLSRSLLERRKCCWNIQNGQSLPSSALNFFWPERFSFRRPEERTVASLLSLLRNRTTFLDWPVQNCSGRTWLVGFQSSSESWPKLHDEQHSNNT